MEKIACIAAVWDPGKTVVTKWQHLDARLMHLAHGLNTRLQFSKGANLGGNLGGYAPVLSLIHCVVACGDGRRHVMFVLHTLKLLDGLICGESSMVDKFTTVLYAFQNQAIGVRVCSQSTAQVTQPE